MSVLRVALTAATVAVTVVRHPMVQAGLRAAPLLITPKVRQAAKEAALDAAYTAGAFARKLVSRK